MQSRRADDTSGARVQLDELIRVGWDNVRRTRSTQSEQEPDRDAHGPRGNCNGDGERSTRPPPHPFGLDSRHGEPGIMLEDLALELAQLRPRLEAELLDQPVPRRLKVRERFGLTACPIESKRQLAQQSLAKFGWLVFHWFLRRK